MVNDCALNRLGLASLEIDLPRTAKRRVARRLRGETFLVPDSSPVGNLEPRVFSGLEIA